MQRARLLWPSAGSPRISEGTRVIERTIGNFVLMVAVTKRSVVPFLDSSLAMHDTMLELVTEGSEEYDASSSVSPAGQLHACCPGETF